MHPGLGKDGAGMSRVGLNALDLPAVEEEPCGRSVRQPAEVTPGELRSVTSYPDPTRVIRGREATVIRKG